MFHMDHFTMMISYDPVVSSEFTTFFWEEFYSIE